VVAQDMFLAQNDLPPLTTIHAPTKGDQLGCGDSCDAGDDFDHWNDHALSGALSKICFKLGSVKAIHDKDWITGGQFCYGGRCESQGTGASDCFALTTGEVIMKVDGTTGCTPRGADHWGVSSIKITLNSGRSKYWGGRECDTKVTLTAPAGQHITSFYGRASGGHLGWGGLFNKIGVYYDVGAAQARWVQIAGGPGVVIKNFDYSVCTTASSSTHVEASSEWSTSTMSETSEGFELEGESAQKKKTVTHTEASKIVAGTSQSFETTECSKSSQACSGDLNYAFQFVFTTNFDGRGEATTYTRHWACSDKEYVCCLPDDFMDPGDASKGCKTGTDICS